MGLILASASPRRAELLTSAGFTFTVRPADVDETPVPGEAPDTYVLRIARSKAETIAARVDTASDVVLAADTTVTVAGEILGKPEDRADAVRMLERLSGTVHDVFTGVVVVAAGATQAEIARTRVRVSPLTSADINWYIDTGEAEGKAGAYGIQGRAARFIDWIEGSWSNVVGLPVATVHQMLKRVPELCLPER